MYAVVAISPKGTEMVASVHPSEQKAREALEVQCDKRGDLWIFVIRTVVSEHG